MRQPSAGGRATSRKKSRRRRRRSRKSWVRCSTSSRRLLPRGHSPAAAVYASLARCLGAVLCVGGAAAVRGCARAAAPSPQVCAGHQHCRNVGDHQRRLVRRGRGLCEAAFVCSLAEKCQRAGPAGRESPGKCWRLLQELAYEQRPMSTPQLGRSGAAAPGGFDFVSPPQPHALAAALAPSCCGPQRWRRHLPVRGRRHTLAAAQQQQHQRGRGRRNRPCSGAEHLDAAPAEP